MAEEATSFAADLSSAMDSASTEPSAATTDPSGPGDAPTTAAPAFDPEQVFTSPPPAPKAPGPIPFEVHKKALDNARDKAKAEWQEKYGWAEQVDREQLTRAVEIARQSQADPIGYLQQYLRELQAHPVYSAKLHELQQTALQQVQAQRQSQAEPQPDLEYVMPNGQKVALYSAQQQAHREAWLRQQVLSQAGQSLQPVLQAVQQIQQRDALLQQQADTAQYVESTYQDVTTWPGMDDPENQKAVGQALGAMRIDENDAAQVSWALNVAWRQVVLPKLLTGSRQAVVADLHQQAEAGKTARSGRGSTGVPTSLAELPSTGDAIRAVIAQMAGT